MAGSPKIIVVGNEKGGSGKSTTAMHLAVGLLAAGVRVGTIDLDARQATLSRYVENRRHHGAHLNGPLRCPEHHKIPASDERHADAARADERGRLSAVLTALRETCDVVIMDCPGTDSHLSRFAHSFADTLLTPLNDSFIDLDNLADVAPDTFDVVKPSRYAEMVWEQRKARMLRDRGSIDWIVMRNRLSALDAKNKRRVGRALAHLAKRIGFRVAPGFGERVIYRELFLSGLTVLDMPAESASLSLSQVAARQELRTLLETLRLPFGAALADAV